MEWRAIYVITTLRKMGYDIPSRYLTDKQKQKIVQLHLEGYNTVQISKELGINDSTVGSNLTKLGYTERIGPSKKLTAEQGQIVIEQYVSEGKSSIELGPIYEVDPNTICNILRRHEIAVRRRGTVPWMKRNDHFSKIDDSYKSYYIGLLTTDGGIVRNRQGNPNVIGLLFKKADKYIIETFAEQLGLPLEKVKDSGTRNESYLRFHSFEMAEDLAKYGIVNNKSPFQ